MVRSSFHTNERYAIGSAPEGVPPRGEAAFLPDGVLATGDVGHLDAEGFLYVSGRLNDTLVLASGRKVQPAPIEAALQTSEAIAQCCVVGQGQPFVSAIVVLATGANRAQVERDLLRINASFEAERKVLGWVAANAPFDADNGLLTATGKLKRKAIELAHREALHCLYRRD